MALDDVHGVEHAGRGELPTDGVDVDVEAVRVAAEAAQELVLVDPALLVAEAVLLGQAGVGERQERGMMGARAELWQRSGEVARARRDLEAAAALEPG